MTEYFPVHSCWFSVPHRDAHEKQLNALKQSGQGRTKIIGSPHFPYEENTLLIECDSEKEDGGISDVQKFIMSDPYVQNNIVSSYSVKEFALKGSVTDFDRLSSKFVLRS